MDLSRAAEVLTALVGTARDADNRRYLGAGLVRCGSCDGPLAGENDFSKLIHDRRDEYYCPRTTEENCSSVRASAPQVDRELQALARERWSDPALLARRHRRRLAELDAEIAEGRQVKALSGDKQRREELARRVYRRYRKPDLEFQRGLARLAWHMTDLVIERAAVAAALDGKQQPALGALPWPLPPLWPNSIEEIAALRTPRPGNYLSTLTELRSAYHSVSTESVGMLGLQTGSAEYRALVPGSPASPGYLEKVESQWWHLLGQTEWQDPGEAWHPKSDKALTEDWGKVFHRPAAHRRSLLVMALGSDTVVLDPATKGAPWIRVVPKS